VTPRPRAVAELEQYYGEMQASFTVSWAPEYASLVVPNGNGEAPIHRWFHLKEAYSSRFIHRVLQEIDLLSSKGARVLDPYAGAGTTATTLAQTAMAGELSSPLVYGIETNPFLHLLASTKLAALKNPPRHFKRFARNLGSRVLDSRLDPPTPPALSTFHRSAYFDLEDVRQLMRLRSAIDSAEARGTDRIEISLARVCLGTIIEPVSNLRRDGRTLRYVEKPQRPPPVEAFLAKAEEIDEDLPSSGVNIRGRVVLGDGRTCDAIDKRFAPFDLIVFSPPYPNNIDYTEVYKLENWLLGYIGDSEDFSEQRSRTVYSHPSILRPEPLPSPRLSIDENELVARIVAPLEASVPLDRYWRGRVRMIRGYCLDMFLTMRAAEARLAPGGWVVYVVGNSVHGHSPHEFVIAADLLMAELAKAAGLAVDRIAVARKLGRRVATSPYLRESVAFLRRQRS
jgi:hypothetical protein